MISNKSGYHRPVMVREVKEYFITDENGIYLDGTLGGGGHAENLLQFLGKNARYIGLDQDQDAIDFSRSRLAENKNFSSFKCNFADFDMILEKLNISKVNGIFLDLGVSSFQIDEAGRGFSYMQQSDLDMRMDRAGGLTAREIVNTYSREKLVEIFKRYGEDFNSRRIAARIIEKRQIKQLSSSDELKKIITSVSGPKHAVKSYARIFQALRIEVNREIDSLKKFLEKCLAHLLPAGRLVVLAYHSLEDREIKQFLRTKQSPCECPPDFPVCVCGKQQEMKILTKKPVKASAEEIEQNPRARSAVLRAGEKI